MEQRGDDTTPITPPTPAMPTPTPPASAEPMMDGGRKSNNGLKIITAIACVIAICGIGFGIYGILKSAEKDKDIIELRAQINALNEQIENAETISNDSSMSGTTWIASGGSEVVFSETRIDWYQDPEEHSDNYYSGVYKFYIGKEAVDYVTQELPEYGVTRSELSSLFNRSDNYSEDNFVVFDIRYDKFILDGEEQEIARPLVPWYGFILDDNTFLDVANMNTGTYYKFTKSE